MGRLLLLVGIAGLGGALARAQDQVEKDIILYSKQLLTNDSERFRYEAAVQLSKHGPRAKSAVPVLAKALVDPSSRVREAARNALVCIGPASVGGLVGSMRTPDPAVRTQVAGMIDHFGEHCGVHMRTLISMLGDDEPAVRDRLADALGKLGEPALLPLLEALDAGRPEVRLAAGRALGRLGPPALPRLMAELVDPESGARDGAARGLGIMGPAADVALEPLRATFGDAGASDLVRAECARAIGGMGEKAQDAAPQLAEGLRSGSAPVRDACIEALERIGAPALGALAAAAKDPLSQGPAIDVLVRLGPLAWDTLDAMLDERPDLARAALRARAGAGQPLSEKAREAARRMLRAEDPESRRLGAQMLTRPGEFPLDPAVEKSLVELLGDPDAPCRMAAVNGLGPLLPESPALEALRRARTDPDVRVRIAAARSCWLADVDTSESLQMIGEALRGEDLPGRAAAAEALAETGGAADAFVDDLIANTVSGLPPELRRSAARALAAIARFGGGVRHRSAAWRKIGSSNRTARAITAGLKWLAAHQDTEKSGVNGGDGKWSADGFGRHDPKPPGDDVGRAQHTIGVTGLALQAFLGIGYTDRGKDPLAANVREGLQYLMRCRRADGSMGETSGRHFLSNHAVATIALAEAWILTCDPKYRVATREAVECIVRRQGPAAWGYEPGSATPNMETTAWCVTAIALAQLGGISVEGDSLSRAGKWISSVTEAGGAAGYDRLGGGVFRPPELAQSFPADKSRATTAAACWCRFLIGGALWDDFACTAGQIDVHVGRNEYRDDAKAYDLYFWQFGSLLMRQSDEEWWLEWRDVIEPRALVRQVAKGPAAGSWDPRDVWGSEGGRVYSTAMAVLTLEAACRFPFAFMRPHPLNPRITGTMRSLLRDSDPELAEIARRAVEGN